MNTDIMHSDSRMSRRSFIKNAGVVAAGATSLAAIAGCSSNTAATTSSSSESTAPASGSATTVSSSVPKGAYGTEADWALEEVGEATETMDADFVIVGGGGTGMAAGIEAAEAGLSVIILEKASVLGGNFQATEGMFGIETHWQKEKGETTTITEAVKKCIEYHHYIPNQKIYDRFFAQTAETVEWCEAHGCTFRDVVAYNNYLAWHVYYYDEQAESPGAYFTKSLETATRDAGVEIVTSAPVKKILKDGDAVSGVIAVKDDGTVLKVNAPTVLIATGGYSSNTEFLHAVSPFTVNENIQAMGMPNQEGDGIRMGAAAGAAVAEGLGTVMWCGPCAVGAGWATDAYTASVQPTLWVNQHGERYINEDLWIGNFAAGGIACRNQKTSYVIFTEGDLANWEQTGPYGAVFTFGIPGVAMAETRAQLERLDSVHKADTIADLADSVGIDADALQKTVDNYNDMCAAGEDTEFGKAKEYLTPVEEGPFWILTVADGFYTTVGGLKINENTEVLDADGNVIPGLFCGGCDAGGLYGDSYDVSCAPGSQASWGINSGRIAAQMAAEYLKA